MPEGWAWCRLGEICDYGKCINVDIKELKPEDWILNLEDIEKESGKIIKIITFSERKSESTKHKFFKGQVLYSKLRPYLNKVVIAPKDGFCTSEILPLDFKMVLISKYAQCLLMSSHFLSTVNMLTYGVKMPRLGTEDAKKLLLPIPPKNEQENIVNSLEQIFTQINLLENDNKELQTSIKQAKSKILDLAIHGKLVPQNPTDEPAEELLKRIATSDNRPYEKLKEEPFEIPDSWCWTKLENLGQTNIGLTYHPEDVSNKGIIVLRSNNINNDTLILDDVVKVHSNTKILENQYIENGDILICARNGSQNLVGKCTLISGLKEKTSFGAFMAVFRSQFNPYILRYLQSKYFKDYMFESNSTQIHQLTQSMLKDALVPLPPEAEQKRIIEKINQMYSSLEQIQSNLV